MAIAQLDPSRKELSGPVTEGTSARREDANALTPGEAGYFAQAWRHLRRDRSALFGAALVLLIALAAIGAPILAPHDPT